MAIDTLDKLIAGFKPIRYWSKTSATVPSGKILSTWPLAGIPGAGAYDTTLNGVTLSSSSALVAGQLPHFDPTSGLSSYLARLSFASTQSFQGMVYLCDRLWHNGGINVTSTSAQNITSPTWPARDDGGATNGNGVLLGLEISSAIGAASSRSATISYTDQDNNPGASGVSIDLTSSSDPAGIFYRIGLASGDFGVRSVQSLTLSGTLTSGTVNLVAYRVIAELIITPNNSLDAISGGMPVLYNGAVPFMLIVCSAGSLTYPKFAGSYGEAQG